MPYFGCGTVMKSLNGIFLFSVVLVFFVIVVFFHFLRATRLLNAGKIPHKGVGDVRFFFSWAATHPNQYLNTLIISL